ncbi:MAG: WD40 repeat domain-containing protein [Patescibacteria group bacterium]
MRKIFSSVGVILITCTFVSPVAAAGKYNSYDYENKVHNYHLTETEVSFDGSVVVEVSDIDSNTPDILTVFTPDQQKPAWTYEDADPEAPMFDVDISKDSSTIVVCGGKIWVFDVATESLIWDLEDEANVWDACTLSEDGSEIYVANRASSVAHFTRTSNEIQDYWTMDDGGFVTELSLSEDGTHVLAANDYAYTLIDLTSGEVIWEEPSDDQIVGVGLNEDGTKGFILTDEHLDFLKTTSGSPVWSRSFDPDTNTPRASISNDGSRIVLTTNDEYLGLKTAKHSVAWRFKRNGSDTTLGMSQNGKFAVITEGLDYIYLFDWDFKKKQRPMHIRTAVFPRGAGLSGDGSALAYTHGDFHFEQIPPGVLVTNQDIPVYSAGMSMDVQYFVSNPGKKADLKLKTSLSLPQFSFLDDLGASVDGEPAGVKMKLLEYANKTLPGYEVVDEQAVTLKAHTSKAIETSFTVPDMITPDWLGDLLDLLGLDNVFDDLMGELAAPLSGLVNSGLSDAMTEQANSSKAEGVFPLLGLAKIQLYDPDNNEVYSQDSFMFLYLAY